MKGDEELEMLLGEIPHATSLSLHHHHHPSYFNGRHHHQNDHHHVVNANVMYGRYDSSSSSSSCSYNQHTSIPSASAFPSLFSTGHSSSHTPSSSSSSSTPPSLHDPHINSRNPHSKSENPINEFDLSCNLSRMYINENQNQGLLHHNRIGAYDYPATNLPVSRNPISFNSQINPAFIGFQPNYALLASPHSNFDKTMLNHHYQWGIPAVSNGLYKMGIGGPHHLTTNHDPHRFEPIRANGSSNIRTGCGLGLGLDGLAASEDSLIIQGDDLTHIRTTGLERLKGYSKRAQLRFDPTCTQFMNPCENGRTGVHLAEVRKHIYIMAKDQHGCRYLQKIFDDGNPEKVEIVFDEIIGHVIELMINPFGNYLMQKLLEVCNEEQRMCILMEITREPMELVRISLNTHGTRVVQKLIETLKTMQQVRLVISALEPGFLALTKDLNGNHVIQRCLQCLSSEDNKFIFEAATKFCVEIATHQHGCCVLQKCINHSTGKHRENLVAEVSANGLLLAQDAFGNYVVQYILELKIRSVVSKLMAQFEGNFVHLSTQKFSSHVVEKCLAVLDGQVRCTIVRELVAAPRFDHLLQDPHANYVIQTALRVVEGPLHDTLVQAIESHKAISRNSPYSKRIFSHKLLKR